jgi:NAD(P)H-nitrite reductase large subunit
LPGKLKMGVSGCLNQCAESSVKDLGLVGKAKGWTILVGGNAASRARIGVTLSEDLSSEKTLATCARVIAYFKENGKKGERMGRFIDRVGFETFKAAVLAG